MKTFRIENQLKLKNSQVISQGNRQFVYQNPDDPNTLLKVPQPHTTNGQANLVTDSWFDRKFRRSTTYKGFLREFHESFDLMVRFQNRSDPIPVCEVRGVLQTDIGIALVYERISDPDGQLSPSLQELAESGRLTPHHLDCLDKHFDELIEAKVLVSNKNTRNIVFQTFPDGSGRWVWIDSFGSKQIVPVRRWFQFLNRRKINQIRERFMGVAEDALRRSAERGS
ncbi:YrbL family protein [Ruegeria profundi]|uniref:YrbL family protein n=1 Tax=Ruegeria profundi TaxID=1685378 RepID=UPI001CD772E7|nr:YrbL family protein [Ruegeria profundi]MCA0926975.1 PhoP regulatory network YrbL family protein [Ruegeria profundi]